MTVLPVIAIDGPSGVGKSTLARAVAARLGLTQIDTGALYRAATRAVLSAGIDPTDTAAVAQLIGQVQFSYEPDLLLDGADPGDLRAPEVNAAVSYVAAVPSVRERLVEVMRRRAVELGGTVMEGRDIGTVVFPDAIVKVYLEADDDVRVQRRLADEHQAGRRHLDSHAVRSGLGERDRIDSTREVAPLSVPSDALRLDSTTASVDDLAERVVAAFRDAGERS